ncbi:hypothetical protein ACXYTP_18665 [Tsukamurella ocularis]|uniref:hypothetical protein n=1 Tax=Tsukamurella ocularis TaxID=1970234 RepID=UPI0039EEAA91
MSAPTKITGLNRQQTEAINRLVDDELLLPYPGPLVVTATTATFPWEPGLAASRVRHAQLSLGRIDGTRGGHYQALHAVIRKLKAQTQVNLPVFDALVRGK